MPWLGMTVAKDTVTATVLLSHLHNLVLSETIGAHQPIDTDRAISDAIAVLWNGLAP